jgi:hypothetical protein
MSGANQAPPDPLLELKKQEIANTAKRDETRAQIDGAKLQLDQTKENNDMQIDQARMQQAQQIANERNAVALSKMAQTGGQNARQTQ